LQNSSAGVPPGPPGVQQGNMSISVLREQCENILGTLGTWELRSLVPKSLVSESQNKKENSKFLWNYGDITPSKG